MDTGLRPGGGCASAIAVDPQNPGTVLAVITLFEAVGKPADAVGELFKSSDGGAIWRQVVSIRRAGICRHPLLRLSCIDPQNPGTVYLGTAGYGLCCEGLFKTTDGGASWSAVTSGIRATNVSALTIDPQNPGTFYTRGLRATDCSRVAMGEPVGRGELRAAGRRGWSRGH